jgi:pyruvate dehydrogenase E2 component (dihydrolipoamide acetyltransferase)
MDVADLTELEAFRRKHKQQVVAQGGALSLTVFAMKAAAAALKKFPRFNSSIDMESEEIIIKHYHNIGFAVDTDRGLLVPVIRDVDCKSIFDLAVELKDLAEKTRQGQATKDDMSGGTFTITNVGPMGGTGLCPIINYPEVAILGMAQARLQPKVIGDEKNYEIIPRLMLPLNITFDHRVLDGAEAARFLKVIIETLENPENLLMMS